MSFILNKFVVKRSLPVIAISCYLIPSTLFGAAENIDVPHGGPGIIATQDAALITDRVPALSRLQVLAAANHPSVVAAEMALVSAGLDLRASRWQRFPSVSVQGQALSTSAGLDRVEAVVEQPLWQGGAINASIRASRHRQDAALARYDEAVQQILLAVSEAYYDLCRWRLRGLILTESLSRHVRMVETMERRVRQDVSPVSDLELARTRTVQIEHQLAQASSQAEKAQRRLRELIGDSAALETEGIADPPSWPVLDEAVVLKEALEFSPRLRFLRAEASALQEDSSVARARTLPRLGAEYRYGDQTGHRVGIVLKAQVSGGLSGFAAAKSAQLRAEAAEFQIDSAERDLRAQLVSDLQDYNFNRDRLGNSASAAASAQRVMESYMRQFTSGRRTWLDVMNAVREANSADIDALEARILVNSAMQRVMLSTGSLQLGKGGAGV